MPDYGHDIQFGTFITPSAADPRTVVTLAQLSEVAGFDLVTFQDHPYNSGFLDTCTLMTYVAAATTRIRIAPNVLNLALRPPAVLARAAASLDLLSGGRFEMGLGSGAFWDGIEAMGGRRLTAGQAVSALEEGIDIIRALWDTSTPTGVRLDGTHHHIKGAKRGPTPAHDIAIWLGAYKPRMLGITGRAADGWLPSLPYLKAGDLARGNAIIDAAAVEAGRQAGAIRRLLNVNGRITDTGRGQLQGPVSQWVEELTAFAVEDGIGTFIVMGDEPATMERLGAEVVPAVREAVATARLAGVTVTERPVPVSVATASASPAQRPGVGVTPTRDDGIRLSKLMRWDERNRPSAPLPDPSATYSDDGRQVAQHLIEVHDHLRAELLKVRDIVEQVKSGTLSPQAARTEVAELTLRQNDWVMGAYCASYCRTVATHHSLEDEAVFPYLRRTDDGLRPVIDRLEAEHRVIHEVLEEDRRGAHRFRGPAGRLRGYR